MPLKVLVVDDATFVRDMVKRTLRQMIPDIELFEAPDGARAMGLIKSKSPDLILSDWEMPEMSGDDLLRWLREQPQFAETPFVMITSRGDRNHVMAAVSAGVSDYLSKPFSAEELTRKINKQLKRLGYQAPKHRASSATMASSSIDVLMAKNLKTTPATHKPNSKLAVKAANAAANNFKGQVFLRFPHTSCQFSLSELSIQAMGGTIERPDLVPSVFDQAAVDLISEDGQALARLNAYIHSISASTPSPDATVLRVIARFVDQDPEKQALLQSLLEP